MPRIVLAYSGSFEGSLAIRWLKEQHGAEVIALTLDFGQGRELEAVQDRALATGALRAHVLDVRDEYAREFALASVKADALGDAGLVLARALTRPLVARKLVEIAEIERATAGAHGPAAADDAPAPLDRLITALRRDARVLAPEREWRMDRQGQLAFAAAHGIVAGPPNGGHHRVETNLWGRWIQTNGTAAAGDFTLTRAAAECPAEAATVEIAFERGVPRAINGVPMPLLELIASLATIAGAHGVGRTQSAGVACEAPAAVLLHDAHRQLAARVLPEDLRRFAETASRAYTEIICRGGWFTPLREALDGFFDKVQERANGTVRLRLFQGQVTHE